MSWVPSRRFLIPAGGFSILSLHLGQTLLQECLAFAEGLYMAGAGVYLHDEGTFIAQPDQLVNTSPQTRLTLAQ